ncbi:MAG: hypothetical protein RR405_05520 [Clostridia bacterium]
MSTDPFVILGIDKGSSQSEILEAYKAKKQYYSSRLFNEGEEGSDAARSLEQLETAFQAAMEYCHQSATVSGEGESSFEEVKAAINEKNLEGAQKLLDGISYRGGEWHYYQSIVFYSKSWLAESKKQLEIALELDPSNEKYKKALNNIKKKVDGSKPFSAQQAQTDNQNQNQNQNNTYTQRSYQQPTSGDAGDGCCAACQAMWCADCCCECMGGDLIRCC